MQAQQLVSIFMGSVVYRFQNFSQETVDFSNREWGFTPFTITEENDEDSFNSQSRTITTVRDFWDRESMESEAKNATVEIFTYFPELGELMTWIGQVKRVLFQGAVVSFELGHPLTAIENQIPNKLISGDVFPELNYF
jgi:hypothetical protein